ncbi:MAG: GTP-binding protein [Acidobacteriota bacterium]|nr:GTP-binding protein [Acidobacteriota bacterium]
MPNASPVRIALITGYLGAGKTTLLNNILANGRGVRAAVIVNDIGEVNIDADLIAQGGMVNTADESLVPLTNGCICCTLADDLARQLAELAESGRFDHIIIEASGICEPIPIAFTIDNFCKQEVLRGVEIDLDNIIAVVDSRRMFDQFHGGRDLLADGIGDEDIEALLIQQIEFCTTMVLNKADLVSPGQLAELRALVRGLQREATIIEAEHGQVDIGEMLSTDRFDFDAAYGSAAWMEALEHPEEHENPEVLEYGIQTLVYERRRPFDMDRLQQFAQSWPDEIIRCKGLAWFADDPDMAYVFEQAGRQIHLQENGLFVDSAPDAERERVIEANPEIMEQWDPEVGDRMTKLVVIGRHMSEEGVVRGFDSCLVDWQRDELG